jgi:hypothetical protein
VTANWAGQNLLGSEKNRRSQVKYRGSCHCGKIAVEVEGLIDKALACNCSICSRKGSLLWFVPREQLTVEADDENIGTYQFNKHLIRHRFCRTCGIHPYAEGIDPQGRAMAAINLRCLGGLDLERIPVQQFDGLAL